MLLRSTLFHLQKRFLSSQCCQEIEIKKYGPVTLISINRPSKRNALNATIISQLKQAINEFENDDSATSAVLSGEGGNFCAGYDLKEFAENEDVPDYYMNNDLTEKYVKKPMIAAVNGYAVGAGIDLALWCDLRIMDETAVFGCLGRRYGSSVSEIGLKRLQAMVGISKAMDIVLTGRTLKSEEALNCGLVSRVVACGTVVGQAINFANDMSKFPQAGLLKDRAVLYRHASTLVPLKNIPGVDDCGYYKQQIIKDMKKGAKLFTTGAGKQGKLFSQYLWQNV